MSRSRKKGILRKVLFVVAGLAVVFFFAFGGTLLDTVLRARDRARLDLAKRLSLRHGIVFLTDFDAAVPADDISLLPLQCQSVRRVKGVFGTARRNKIDEKA